MDTKELRSRKVQLETEIRDYIAAAIKNFNNEVVAGITIVLPAMRYTDDKINYYGNLLYQSLNRISI